MPPLLVVVAEAPVQDLSQSRQGLDLGEPQSIERNDLDETSFTALLRYDGLWMDYIKVGSENVRLRKLKLTSPKWSINVNGNVFRPGMKSHQLSQAVRNSMREISSPPPDSPDVDASATFRVANPAKNGKAKGLKKNTRFTFQIDKDTGEIKGIVFLRLI